MLKQFVFSSSSPHEGKDIVFSEYSSPETFHVTIIDWGRSDDAEPLMTSVTLTREDGEDIAKLFGYQSYGCYLKFKEKPQEESPNPDSNLESSEPVDTAP